MGSSRERMKSISEVCDERATQPVFSIYSLGQRNVHLQKKDEEKKAQKCFPQRWPAHTVKNVVGFLQNVPR